MLIRIFMMTSHPAKTEMNTQIMYMNIQAEHQVGDIKTQAGSQWSKALDVVQNCDGLKGLHWGRRLEEPEKIQLHIGESINLTWPILPEVTREDLMTNLTLGY